MSPRYSRRSSDLELFVGEFRAALKLGRRHYAGPNLAVWIDLATGKSVELQEQLDV